MYINHKFTIIRMVHLLLQNITANLLLFFLQRAELPATIPCTKTITWYSAIVIIVSRDIYACTMLALRSRDPHGIG